MVYAIYEAAGIGRPWVGVPSLVDGRGEQSRIRTIKARPVSYPLSRPIRTSQGAVTSASLVLVDVLTDSGVTGSAYVSVYTPAALISLTAMITGMKPFVEGEPLNPFKLTERLVQAFRLDGRTGLIGCAMSGIDMAVWDALAREGLMPLAHLLGGDITVPIATYASLTGWTVEELVCAAAEALDLGFVALKAKIGHPTLAQDLDVVRALRATAGDAVALMVDYNQLLTVEDALTRCAALSDEGVAWIEEPIRSDDHAGNARVTRSIKTAIQLGENFWSSETVRDALDANASDLLMFDAMRIGGVTGWMHAGAEAGKWRKPVSSHAFMEYSSHLLAATPTNQYLEWLDRAGPLMIEGSPSLRNGRAYPLPGPGSGIVWDEQVVRRFQAT